MNGKATLSVFAAAVLTSYAAPKDILEKSFDVKPGGKLMMQVDRGSIHVTTSESDRVQVHVVRELKRASESKAREVYASHQVNIEQDGDTVEIRADHPRKFHLFKKDPFNDLQVAYTVAIPSRFNVDLHTAGGSLKIGELHGTVLAKTAGGPITLAGVHGSANLHTAGGNLKIGRVSGDLIARTSGGGITIDAATGSIDAQTAGGPIEVRDAKGPVHASTSGGSVSASFTAQPNSKSSLTTSGGPVSVTLPQDVALSVTARTSGGSIHSDFAGDWNKHHTSFVGPINGGGPELVLSTAGGNIRIVRR
jgi:DUF4097 and DUF4098 domain-containing protein YvlB